MFLAAPVIDGTTGDALARLSACVRAFDSVVVAFSGGFDSALVLAIAVRELGDRVLALTTVSPSLPARERDDAVRIATSLGARHELAESRELQDPNYAANPVNRCFHCKTELYRIAESRRAELGFACIANGTNVDDLGDHRPGLEAADRAHVRSPLVEAGLRKDAARAIARTLGLDFWDKPAAACLSSRIPHGNVVTPERLARIERLEDALHALGLRQVRVRWHDAVARVEVPVDAMERAFALREPILAAGRAAGFTFVTLDLAGYRQGSLNQLLPIVR